VRLRITRVGAFGLYSAAYLMVLSTGSGPFSVLGELTLPLWVPAAVTAAGAAVLLMEPAHRHWKALLAASISALAALWFAGMGAEVGLLLFLVIPVLSALHSTVNSSAPAGVVAYSLLLVMLLGFHSRPLAAAVLLLSLVLWMVPSSPSDRGWSAVLPAAVSLTALAALWAAAVHLEGYLQYPALPGNMLFPAFSALLVLLIIRILAHGIFQQPSPYSQASGRPHPLEAPSDRSQDE